MYLTSSSDPEAGRSYIPYKFHKKGNPGRPEVI